MNSREEKKRLREQRRKELLENINRETPADEVSKEADTLIPEADTVSKENPLNTKQDSASIKNAPETNIEETKIETVNNPSNTPVSLDTIKLDYTFKVLPSNEERITTSIGFNSENFTFLKKRAAQLGMNMQDYLNLLVVEEDYRRDNDDIQDEFHFNENDFFRVIKTCSFSKETMGMVEKGAAYNGMKKNVYINMILNNEQQRESKYGKRLGKYD